jgi:transcription initiation factor IIF auxiliary subunit
LPSPTVHDVSAQPQTKLKKQKNTKTTDYSQYFQTMYDKIVEEESNLADLHDFKNKMVSSNGAFDSDDTAYVDQLINDKEADVKLLRSKYQEKSDMYTKVLVGLKSTIDTRNEIIGQFDKRLLQKNTELRDFLVKKQAILNSMYVDACKKIIE